MNKWMRLTSIAVALVAQLSAQGVRNNAGFTRSSVPRNDDGSSPLVPLGFTINFFGQIRSSGYVNNNGNITFDRALSTFTPFGLEGTRSEIIAPFFADVDTRSPLSKLVTYGNDTVNGHNAFGVNYVDVGYYSTHADKLNSFQVVLIDRSDLGTGNFDVEFNYNRITWETGDASGGVGGLGNVSASAGWSNGTALGGTSYQLPGSLIPGAFLDNGPYSLARRKQYSSSTGIPSGRFTFRARDGVLLTGLGISTGAILGPASVGTPFALPLLAIGGNSYRWTLINDPGATLPWLSLSSAGLLSGTPTATGTYEFTASVVSNVEGTDFNDARRYSLTVVPQVLQIDQRSCPLPVATEQVSYAAKLLASGGSGQYIWSWGESSPVPGLALSESGAVSGIPTRAGNYIFNLRVAGLRPELADPGTRQCTLIVQPAFPEPSIVSCPTTVGTAGVPFTELLRGGGGTAPYRWSATGTLPTGLSVDTAGTVNGIPSVSGAYPFLITMRDGAGRTVNKNCSMTVIDPVLNLSTACPLPEGVTGGAYAQPLAVSGGRAPYTWSTLGNFPVGLSISTGASLTGRPNDAGAYQFRLTVEDADGLKASKNCSLIVQRANLSINSCPLPNAKQGVLYQRTLNNVGGSGNLSWASSGKVPPGLFVSSQGVIFGTATEAGNFEFQLQVRDSSGLAAKQECQIYVEPVALEFSTACPDETAAAGANFRHQSNARGGIAPYRWTVDGTLPPGLRISSDGVISGAPTKLGNYGFEIVGTDVRAREIRKACTISSKLPGLPEIRLSVANPSIAPASSIIPVTIDLPAYPFAIQADVALSSTADTGNGTGEVNRTDPSVRFLGGQRTTSVTIPAGTKRIALQVSTSGTVAGQVAVQISKLKILGSDLQIVPPAASFRINQLAPVLTDACYRPDGSDLQAEITGYSTTRSLIGANVSLNGVTRRTTDISSIANDYYLNEQSIRTGGAFTLFIPVVLPNPLTVDTLTVGVTNRAGSSTIRAARRCQ